MRLSILDFFNAPADLMALSELADRLGYHRYWLGEHHSPSQCANPLLVASLIAGRTRAIRVGSGAVSMMLRNPLLMAEDAQLIDHLFPDRFDLGVAPGLATSHPVIAIVSEGRDLGRDRYQARVRQLHRYLTAGLEASHPLAPALYPKSGPPMWIMGGSPDAAALAAELGVGLVGSFHHHGTVKGIGEVFARYREAFRASKELSRPCAIAVVSGICAETTRQAVALAGSADLKRPERIEFIGSAAESVEKIRGLADAVKADEVMILCQPTRDNPATHRYVYQAFAELWGLRARRRDDDR